MHEVIGRFASAPLRVERIRSAVGTGVATALVLACTLSWPPRLGFYGSSSWVWAYPHEAVQVVRAAKLQNALVFVRGDRLWAALFLDNMFPMTDAAPVIYAQDRGDENRQLIGRYPTRRYFVADSTGLTPFSP